jgi:type I restriction enzyme M protein
MSTPIPSRVIALLPPGRLLCVVTDKLRKDTPEEHVRQRIARSLMDQYGYAREDLELELPINLGSAKKRADIGIFSPNTPHTQETVQIIVECKPERVKPTDKDNGVGQLKSYLAACLNCRYGMWIGSELQVWERLSTPQGNYEFAPAIDIPRFGANTPQPPRFSDLVPAQDELIHIFKRCHDYIYGNQGFQKEPAFQELLKIIFCKVHDENKPSGDLTFFIENQERRSDIEQRKLRNRINALFEAVKQQYPYIFRDDDAIQLNNPVLAYVVNELQRFSLIQTRADVKGAAYEQLVGANLRGDRGEFFTPREVCEMAAQMLLATFPQQRWLDLKLLDPAAGTGGFLVAVMNVWREHLLKLQESKWGNESRAIEATNKTLKDVATTHLFGIDFNPVLVRAAQMNLVMHGDGSTNVFHENSLKPPGEWDHIPPNDVQSNIRMGSFDAILTNPPFGSKVPVDDPHIIEQFELASYGLQPKQSRGAMPPEQLFIERCLDLLRPGGRLAIVLPDSILSNPGLIFIRQWLLEKARIVASIDLPTTTFEPHTGTQTSVLLLQKKRPAEITVERELGRHWEYEVFMAIPRQVGHDRRGNVLHLRTPEGKLIEYEDEVPVYRTAPDGSTVVERRKQRATAIHNELPEVVRSFRAWVQDPARKAWLDG